MSEGWRRRAICQKTSPSVFFPESDTAGALARARTVCRQCPVFGECATWSQEHYTEIPVGIFFGYSSVEREQMYWGTLKYRDWRLDKASLSKRALAALEREALRRGEAPVVAVHGLYEIDDPDERARVIEAYRAWQEDHQFPSTYQEAEERAERLSRIRQGDPTLKGRARSLPPKMRPPCPNGHPGSDMHRIQRKRKDGQEVWCCYKCLAKVVTTVEALFEAAG